MRDSSIEFNPLKQDHRNNRFWEEYTLKSSRRKLDTESAYKAFKNSASVILISSNFIEASNKIISSDHSGISDHYLFRKYQAKVELYI